MDEKLKRIVIDVLRIEESDYREDLKAGDLPAWDSLGHVNLLLEVQKAFGVTFDVNEMVEMESVDDLRRMLMKHNASRPGT